MSWVSLPSMPSQTKPTLIQLPKSLEHLAAAVRGLAGHREVRSVFLFGSTLRLDTSDLDLTVAITALPAYMRDSCWRE